MTNPVRIYMYGMIVQSTIHRLVGSFPKLDTYGEIGESHYLPGGEAGNSAVVLNKLGYRIRLDGTKLGRRTREPVLKFYTGIGVDVSGLQYDDSFDGVEDLVLVADDSRTVFGTYAHFYSIPQHRWQRPDEAAIADSAIVGLDPFFMEESDEVARLSAKHKVPYVTIDCPAESYLSRNAAAVVISNEYIGNHHSGADVELLHKSYTDQTDGLVLFTFGGRDILYGRKGGPICHMKPYKVAVKSTLGAGDTFRAGIMLGLLKGGDDASVVKFGAAMAACVCTRFPIGLFPPEMKEIEDLIASQPR